MAGILVRTCTTCGKVDKFPHNRDDKPAIWNINHELRNTGDPILCNDCQLRGEAINRVNERKTEQEANERQQRENEHKSSHCHQCNNKSSLYHYIFDKRTKKVCESWSNATDPNNELVFCNKTCFDNYLDKEYSFKCEQCYSKIRFDQNYWPLKDKKNIKFCSQDCGVKYLVAKEQQRQEELDRETDRLKGKINNLNKQKFNLLHEAITKGEDISIYEWENADWLDDEQKEICRNYIKKQKELEDLKIQRETINKQESIKLDSDNLTSEIFSQTSHGNDNSVPSNQSPNSNSPDNSNINNPHSDNIDKPQTNFDKQPKTKTDSGLNKRDNSFQFKKLLIPLASILIYGIIFFLIFLLIKFIRRKWKLRTQKKER